MKCSIHPSRSERHILDPKKNFKDCISLMFLDIEQMLNRNPLDAIFYSLGGEGHVAEVLQTPITNRLVLYINAMLMNSYELVV
jgi:hypothetical protein